MDVNGILHYGIIAQGRETNRPWCHDRRGVRAQRYTWARRHWRCSLTTISLVTFRARMGHVLPPNPRMKRPPIYCPMPFALVWIAVPVKSVNSLVPRPRIRAPQLTDTDEEAADEYGHSTTESVGEKATERDDRYRCDESQAPRDKSLPEGKRGDLPQIVDDEDDARRASGAGQAEGVLVGLHGIDGAHERGVKPVHR